MFDALFEPAVEDREFMPYLICKFTHQREVIRPLVLALVARIVHSGEPSVTKLVEKTNIVYMFGVIHHIVVHTNSDLSLLMTLVLEVAMFLVGASEPARVALAEGRLTDQILDGYLEWCDFAIKVGIVRYMAAFLPFLELEKVRAALKRFHIEGLLQELLGTDEPAPRSVFSRRF